MRSITSLYLLLPLTRSLTIRATIGALARGATAPLVIIILTGTFFKHVVIDTHFDSSSFCHSDGGYYYNNPNGSTYHESSSGRTTYTTPGGYVHKGQK